MHVYKAITAVAADMGKEGISKSRVNEQQRYRFRGIDDVYNALSPLLAKHGLCILPRVLSREVVERTTQKGGVLFYVTVEVEFDFVAAEDGTKHTVKTFGEAMDSGDKATNKAMSAAYKYAAMQAFAIPTEGDNDADGTTHEVAPKQIVADAQETIECEHITKLIEGVKTLDALADLWRTPMIQSFVHSAPPHLAKLVSDAKETRKRDLAEKVAA